MTPEVIFCLLVQPPPHTHRGTYSHAYTHEPIQIYSTFSLDFIFWHVGYLEICLVFRYFGILQLCRFFYFKSLVQFLHYSKNPQHGLISIVLPFLGHANLCLRMWSTVVEAPGQRHADLVWWSEVFYKYQKAQSRNS